MKKFVIIISMVTLLLVICNSVALARYTNIKQTTSQISITNGQASVAEP